MRNLDEFTVPEDEIELLDKVKYYYYNEDMVGLIRYLKFLYKAVFEKGT